MDRASYLDRARNRGVNPLVYWIVRAVVQPFFHLYFRMSRIGREHVLPDGPMIIAANHRSFLDPFVIGTILRRPVYFVAKQELFRKPLTAWFLNSLGAFPIDRGNADGDAMVLAKEILERGDVVAIFPEGTRVRPGALGTPRRGVGRLALETGAPVLPVAVIGTERIRQGWRIRPHKVRVRVGPALRFPRVEDPSPELARAVTDRIWPCVALQWEWLGGLAPVRRAAVVGQGTTARRMADALRDARVEVTSLDLVAGTTKVARIGAAAVSPAAEPELATQDLVLFAVPDRELPAAVDVLGPRIPHRAGVLVAATGPVPGVPSPVDYVAQRSQARAVAALAGRGDEVVVASADRGFARQLGDLLRSGGLEASESADVRATELAAVAATAAELVADRSDRPTRGPRAVESSTSRVA
jgi:glycerol-3-phosphate dehydrogenase (NAD(P)+)